MLRFNTQAFEMEFLNILKQELEYAFSAWENDVKSNMQHPFYKTSGEVAIEFQNQKDKLIAHLKANSYVLADSFGTGSLMLDDNPIVKEYIGNTRLGWNPDRKGKTIVGRRSGTYTDVFGRTHHTTGRFKGMNIEGMKVHDSVNNTPYYITPTPPSRALRIANQYLYKQWLPTAYQYTIKRINFAKFLIES